jgi:hypothetical protein
VAIGKGTGVDADVPSAPALDGASIYLGFACAVRDAQVVDLKPNPRSPFAPPRPRYGRRPVRQETKRVPLALAKARARPNGHWAVVTKGGRIGGPGLIAGGPMCGTVPFAASVVEGELT